MGYPPVAFGTLIGGPDVPLGAESAVARSRVEFVPNKLARLDMRLVQAHLERSAAENRFANGGPCVRTLEQELTRCLRVPPDKAVVAAASGTAALHALVGALSATRPLRVATQSFTFPCAAQQVLSSAAIIDIDAGGGADLRLVPDDAEAVLVTNCFGHVVDVTRYEEWGRERGILILFDNAAAPLTELDGRPSAGFGDACIISLHHTKPLGFGEGGAIVVDRAIEQRVRQFVSFGTSEDGARVAPLASNFKMSDVAAAFLLAHLQGLDRIRRQHLELYRTFARMCASSDGYGLFPSATHEPFASCLPVLFDAPVSLDDFTQVGIAARRYYRPLRPTPVASRAYERIVCLPLHEDLTSDDLELYAATCLSAVRTPSGRCILRHRRPD